MKKMILFLALIVLLVPSVFAGVCCKCATTSTGRWAYASSSGGCSDACLEEYGEPYQDINFLTCCTDHECCFLRGAGAGKFCVGTDVPPNCCGKSALGNACDCVGEDSKMHYCVYKPGGFSDCECGDICTPTTSSTTTPGPEFSGNVAGIIAILVVIAVAFLLIKKKK